MLDHQPKKLEEKPEERVLRVAGNATVADQQRVVPDQQHDGS
jgi:hypothetical protein